MKIALAQIDTTAGDVPGNGALLRAAWTRAKAERADLLVVPELAVLGYPPRDLLLREGVIRAAEAMVGRLASEFADGPPAVLGTAVRNGAATGRGLFNAAVFCRGGRVEASYAKRCLPTYDVFDEARYFAPGTETVVVEVAGTRVGLSVCEDLWVRDRVAGRRLYDADPPKDLMRAGVDLVVNLSASPYHVGKDRHRHGIIAGEAARMGVPVAYVQLVGGNDDVLFDGNSRVYDGKGRDLAHLKAFEEDWKVVDLDAATPMPSLAPPASSTKGGADDDYDIGGLRSALVMGLRDYARKVGMRTSVLGLSGGIDSAVVACLAAEALGPKNVLGVAMPGPFSAAMSLEDAAALAKRLDVAFRTIPIGPVYEAWLATLRPHFDGRPFDVTEENLQARIRGNILMALSNKLGHLVLTTGNKSEISVGYCTLYGDMCGGLAVISDVWKTRVYDLARHYNASSFGGGGVIPQRSIDRPPSAELRPDQKDTDSLPPYAVLDRILARRIERGEGRADLVAAGEDPATVERILRMVDRNEYKRRQMAPGLKVTPVAFGSGWRMPIARPPDLSGERGI